MIRVTIAVGLLALRLQLAKRRDRLAYVGRHWSAAVA